MGDTAHDFNSEEPHDFNCRLLLQLWDMLGLGLMLACQTDGAVGETLATAAKKLGRSPEQAWEALCWVQREALPACLAGEAGLRTMPDLVACLFDNAPSLFRLVLLPVLALHMIRMAIQQAGQPGATFRDLRARITEPILTLLPGPRATRERARKALSRVLSTAWLEEEAFLGPTLAQRLSTTDLARLAPRTDAGETCADLRAAATAGEDDAALKHRLHKTLGEVPAERVQQPVSPAELERTVKRANQACRGHGFQVRLLPLDVEAPSLATMMKAIHPCALHGGSLGRARCPLGRRCGACACVVTSGATAVWLAGLAAGAQKLLPSLPASMVPLLLPSPAAG